MQIPGIGPKRAMQFAQELHVQTMADLQSALDSGQIAALPRLGQKDRRRAAPGAAANRRALAAPAAGDRPARGRGGHAPAADVPRRELDRARGQHSTLEGDDRRHRRAGGITRSGSPSSTRSRAADRQTGAGCRRDARVDRHRGRRPDRPARGRARGDRRRTAVLHRFEGAQRQAARAGGAQGTASINEYGVFSGRRRHAQPRRAAPRQTSTLPWVCRGFRRSCARARAKSSWPAPASCRDWWSSTTCGATCICTRV